ncbi:class I SAM-dependent methyltransferase [Brevundimonas balnearis]|uniref:Class I SAM-dependent methyltransferase n=1 Tax=Brevundimonas balnearis TaxID=1572858 RepID=A0ABV6QYI2_9CAUL
MNLHFLAVKGVRDLELDEGVSPAGHRSPEASWRGLTLPDGAGFRIRGATRFNPFRHRAEEIGWRMRSDTPGARLEVSFLKQDAVVGQVSLDAADELRPVRLPWPLMPVAGDLDLAVTAKGGDVFVGAHRTLDRSELLALCTGRGVELGPGPKPQVLPGPGVDVRYVEQMAPADWVRLYGANYKHAFQDHLLPHYVTGEAHALPAELRDLDFIFSSHVFEHLANPLGHLRLWRDRLRPGGRIVMVVPDLDGSKDYGAQPTPLAELLLEDERGGFDVTEAHYRRYGALRGDVGYGLRLQADGASIHVHFYNNRNMADVMRWAVENLGFSAFSLQHTPNHKDFHVILEA